LLKAFARTLNGPAHVPLLYEWIALCHAFHFGRLAPK